MEEVNPNTLCHHGVPTHLRTRPRSNLSTAGIGFWCAICKRWTTSHCTEGTTHEGKTILKHGSFSSNKRRGDKNNQSSNNKKPKGSGSSSTIDGLKSLKAELNNDKNSSLLSLITKAAAGEQ
jgi:hypothetical protein